MMLQAIFGDVLLQLCDRARAVADLRSADLVVDMDDQHYRLCNGKTFHNATNIVGNTVKQGER